jgi:hypothetical protein
MTATASGGAGSPSRCPVCGARWRGLRCCGRCGADLAELMQVTVLAWRQRRDGWAALAAGAPGRARDLARSSRALVDSPSARRLELLATWLERPAQS